MTSHYKFYTEHEASTWKRSHKRFGWFISEPWLNEETGGWYLTVQK